MNKTTRFPTGCRASEYHELVSEAKPRFCVAARAGGQEPVGGSNVK